MPRRITVVLCLLAGFVVAVALSWFGAIAGANPGTAPSVGPTRVGRPGEIPGRDLRTLLNLGVTIQGVELTTARTDGWIVRREQRRMIIERTGWLPPSSEPGLGGAWAPVAWIDVYSSGWPLRALEWTDAPALNSDFSTRSRASLREAWELGIDAFGTRGALVDCDGWRRLPIRPSRAGVGLAVNTLVWAGIAGMAFSLPGVVRQQVRRSRELCVACGYAVRDAAGRTLERCPECGTAVKLPAMPESGSPA